MFAFRLSSVISNEIKAKKVENMKEDDEKFDFICDINDNMLDRIVRYLFINSKSNV